MLVSFSLLLSPLFSLDNTSVYKQWFMGPVLTPSATTMSPNHPSIEPVFFVLNTYGTYDSNGKLQKKSPILSLIPYVDIQIGFNQIVGIEFFSSFTTNLSKEHSSTHFEDSTFRLGLQISNDQENSWIPDCRILFEEIFPTGNYNQLDPNKNGIDATGKGSFQTGVHLTCQKLFPLANNRSFLLQWSLGCFVPAPVRVRGANVYGGTPQTKGRVYPGNYLTTFLFIEYKLTRRSAFACECNYQLGERGRFSRKEGGNLDLPSFMQVTIVPEIQYTFRANMGIILAGWFTLAGKNRSAVRGSFLSFLYIF